MIGLGSDKNGWKKVPLGRGRDGGVQRPMENFHFFVDPSLSLSTRLVLAGKYFEMGEHHLHKKIYGGGRDGRPLVKRKVYGEECSACGQAEPSHTQNIFLRGRGNIPFSQVKST